MIRVLVVDDDFMVAKVHCGFVERLPGCAVVGVAHTGEEALSAVRQARPDLVLLDIYLPDMSGLDVLKRLREGDTPTDVLVITAARDVATIRTALCGGAVHYLIKPFTFDVLRDRLDRYAAAHRRLAGVGAVMQDDVDRLFGAMRPTSAQLPKGLTKSTADLVAKALQEADADLSAAECAERSGLSRVSTRRYLEYFVTLGKADVRQRYGAAGGPSAGSTGRDDDHLSAPPLREGATGTDGVPGALDNARQRNRLEEALHVVGALAQAQVGAARHGDDLAVEIEPPHPGSGGIQCGRCRTQPVISVADVINRLEPIRRPHPAASQTRTPQ
jgi:response regulator of citrate/malate metabolism